MIVRLRNPTRSIEMVGPMSVTKLLSKLDVQRETVIVIRNCELIPGDAMLAHDDEIEVRPVISGGAI